MPDSPLNGSSNCFDVDEPPKPLEAVARPLAAADSTSLHDPDAVLPDGPVHGIRCEVEVTRPSDGTELDPRLTEPVLIAQSGKNAGFRRAQEACQLYRALGAIVEPHAQPQAWQDLDLRNTPGRGRTNGRSQLSGAIFFGVCM